jgi:hypothetical protein
MVSTILAVIRISVEGGATSKISEARFGKCHLTITPPEFIKGVRKRRIFRKKIGGRGPTGPPAKMTSMPEEINQHHNHGHCLQKCPPPSHMRFKIECMCVRSIGDNPQVSKYAFL